MVVLDTDFLVGLLRKDNDAVKKFEEIDPNEPLRTTVVKNHRSIDRWHVDILSTSSGF